MTAASNRNGSTYASRGVSDSHRMIGLQQSAGNRAVASSLGVGRPLDNDTRAELEASLGRDLSGIRVHTGTDAARSAQLMNADAYTVGRDIVLGHEGGEGPFTAARGKELVAHEVIHSLQQTSNRGGPPSISPTSTMERDVSLAAEDIVGGRTPSLPAPTGHGIARQFESKNLATLSDEELQREFELVYQRVNEPRGYAERSADEHYLEKIMDEIMSRPWIEAKTAMEPEIAPALEYDESDAEFWFEPPSLREGSVPIFDDETGVIVGFRYGGSYWEIFDLNGEMVESGEVGLEKPLIDPIDLLSGGIVGIGRGLLRGGGRAVLSGAAGGAGRGSAGAVVKAGIAITIKSVSQRAATAIRATYRAIRFQGSLNFTATTARHMAVAGRRVPQHILKLAIKYGKRVADPAGVRGAYQYTIPMIRNGRKYNLEVVLREADRTVLHFLYR